jgi:hypothetical protein
MSAGKLVDIDAGIGEASGHGQRSLVRLRAQPISGGVLRTLSVRLSFSKRGRRGPPVDARKTTLVSRL